MTLTFFRYGGIQPPIAQELHRKNIEGNIANTLATANMSIGDLDAIAVTTRPGLIPCLLIGTRYAKHLSRKHSKPIIPIHHMQAHALTARIENKIDYPFLCLLASGGHCLLTFVKSTTEFMLLGETIDNAPGECLDKVARLLMLRNLPEFASISGGAAIELAAKRSQNHERFPHPLPLARFPNCQFSFSGLKNTAERYIESARKVENLAPDEVIPQYEDLCAAFLRSITRHILHRTQRAMEYCEQENLWQGAEKRSMVFSGGVACNDFIYTALGQLCKEYDYGIYRPSRRLCTDNGVMIAWNGVERWQLEKEKYLEQNVDDIRAEPREQLGTDLVKNVELARVNCQWKKIPIMRGTSTAVDN